jgi:hypothetical protein
MGKYKEKAKCSVVSMRVSEEEKLALEELTLKSRLTISGLMREALELYVMHAGSRTI